MTPRSAILILAGIALAGCDAAATNPEEWDDPAIAVCEWLVKHEDVSPDSKYDRMSASIEGSSAVISYSISVLNTAPETKTRHCEFFLDGAEFMLKDPPVPMKDCQKEIDAAMPLQARLNTDPDRIAAVKALEACGVKLNFAASIARERLLRRDMPLMATGIYPIKREKTKLSPAD